MLISSDITQLWSFKQSYFCLFAQLLKAKDVFACSLSITEHNSKNLFLCFSAKFVFLNATLFLKF